MLTEHQIKIAKASTAYSLSDVHHEHDDCIRIAYQWLDAQLRTVRPGRKSRALKHIIERWAGRYVSTSDVEVAAHLLGLQGEYPDYNISARMTVPHDRRLEGIGEVLAHPDYRTRFREDEYARHEA